MMLLTKRFTMMAACFTMLLALATTGGYSQTGDSDKTGPVYDGDGTLSLEEARSLALDASRSLAKYNLSVRSSTITEKTQFHSYLPSLSLDASASANLWGAGETPQAGESFRASASFGVSENLPLWDGGKNAILRQINALGTESARQDALAGYYAALDASDAAYYGVLEAAANLEAAENALETAALSLSIAEVRRESGMISDAEHLQALAEKESKENARNQARQTLTLSRLKLKNLLGFAGELPELEDVDFSKHEPLIAALSGLDDSGTERVFALLWKQIAAKNPSLAKSAISISTAEKNLSLSKRDYSPTVSASFSTGLNYGRDGLEFSAGVFSLNGKIPLDFWVTAANVEKRKIAREQAAIDHAGAGESLDTEARTALLDLIFRAGQVLSSRRALEYGQRHFDYVMELYTLSRNSLSELYSAAASVLSSQNQLNGARYSFLLGLSKIRGLGLFGSEADIEALVTDALDA